ncbi:MAG: hypothetical protein M1819_003386 [Sarea resinae]|nr:MAG: hypothetical protein M1819_003386 [Sarea resinae]
MGAFQSQFRNPTSRFTEKDLGDLSGKIFLVTGGSSGIGLELVKFLYAANGTIYIAARNADKGRNAIEELKSAYPSSTGQLQFLPLDLSDLSTIKATAEEFLKSESRLDVLWHNAGLTAVTGTTKQGHEQTLGTNCLGPFLLNHFLHPLLVKTAASSPPNSVRVVWLSSAVISYAPAGGIQFDDINYTKPAWFSGLRVFSTYSQSKAGDAYLAYEYAKRAKEQGIVSVSLHPGALKSELNRDLHYLWNLVLNTFILDETYKGAYTELFAGLSPEVTVEDYKRFIIPYGNWGRVTEDIQKGFLTPTEGGTGNAEKFWEFCDAACRDFY